MDYERKEEEEIMFVNIVQEEATDSEEEEPEGKMEAGEELSLVGTDRPESASSDEDLEEEIEKTQAAVDECYRRRAKRAGINIEGTEGRLLTEEELDNLSEQLGDGTGERAKRRREIETMSIEEMEAEIGEVKKSLKKRGARRVGNLPFVVSLLCLLNKPAEGFTAYDCSNRSNIVESYSLLEPDMCANMGKEGEVETTVYGEIV
jgi:hypothetical protein